MNMIIDGDMPAETTLCISFAPQAKYAYSPAQNCALANWLVHEHCLEERYRNTPAQRTDALGAMRRRQLCDELLGCPKLFLAPDNDDFCRILHLWGVERFDARKLSRLERNLPAHSAPLRATMDVLPTPFG